MAEHFFYLCASKSIGTVTEQPLIPLAICLRPTDVTKRLSFFCNGFPGLLFLFSVQCDLVFYARADRKEKNVPPLFWRLVSGFFFAWFLRCSWARNFPEPWPSCLILVHLKLADSVYAG